VFTVGSFHKETRLLACRIFAGCREVHRHFIVRRCGSKAWFSLARRGVRGRALFVIGIIGGIGSPLPSLFLVRSLPTQRLTVRQKWCHAELRSCRDRLNRRKIAENQKNPLIIWIIGLLFEFFLDKTA